MKTLEAKSSVYNSRGSQEHMQVRPFSKRRSEDEIIETVNSEIYGYIKTPNLTTEVTFQNTKRMYEDDDCIWDFIHEKSVVALKI